eukprot:7492902-Heterocapsa_arctica.AAC.1
MWATESHLIAKKHLDKVRWEGHSVPPSTQPASTAASSWETPLPAPTPASSPTPASVPPADEQYPTWSKILDMSEVPDNTGAANPTPEADAPVSTIDKP